MNFGPVKIDAFCSNCVYLDFTVLVGKENHNGQTKNDDTLKD